MLLVRQGTEELLPIRRGEDARLIGLNGEHAEYMTVPETAVFPIPKGVDAHTAADISCAYDKRLIEPRVSTPRRRLCVIHTSPVSAGYLNIATDGF